MVALPLVPAKPKVTHLGCGIVKYEFPDNPQLEPYYDINLGEIKLVPLSDATRMSVLAVFEYTLVKLHEAGRDITDHDVQDAAIMETAHFVVKRSSSSFPYKNHNDECWYIQEVCTAADVCNQNENVKKTVKRIGQGYYVGINYDPNAN